MGSKTPGGLWSLIWHIRTDWWHVFNSKLVGDRVKYLAYSLQWRMTINAVKRLSYE